MCPNSEDYNRTPLSVISSPVFKNAVWNSVSRSEEQMRPTFPTVDRPHCLPLHWGPDGKYKNKKTLNDKFHMKSVK